MVLGGRLRVQPLLAACCLQGVPFPYPLPPGATCDCLPHHAVSLARRHAEAVVPQLHLLCAIDLGQQHITRPLCKDVLLVHHACDAHKVAGVSLGQRDLVACRAGGP